MANEAKKTEHSGSKKGSGAYWGYKKDAKHESNKKRRENGKALAGSELMDEIDNYSYHEALDITKKPREEWDAYDLITPTGLKIEVKSSSYLQSWEQSSLSKIIFGIQPTEDILENNREKIRRSDIYIFCVLSHQNKDTVDPLNLSQWDFYILNTSVLNERVREQKTITLSSLLRLNPVKVKYDGLQHEINR